MSLPAGILLGPYEIVEPLGSGGMGEVYRARDTRLNRDVAIKILAPHLAADPTALIRFEREAQALAALSHPGIVGIYDVGRHEDSAYVVMQFLEGETLRARLASGPLPVRKAVEYAIQTAQALAAAHERGIVHRDLKPENIFLNADGRLKVLDFGIVSLASASAAITAETIILDQPRATGPQMMVGTVGYMAPEQSRGQPVDARADIFALGAVMYEMLTGRRAFDGDTGVDVLANVLHADPPELAPDLRVPPALERIVRRCVEKRPEDRFQSARDLAFALEGVASGSATAGAIADAPPRRVPWWIPIAAALAALALGVGVGRVSRSIGAPAVTPPGAVRFVFDATRGQVPEVSVSPNGRYLAWTEVTRGGRLAGLSVRRLDAEQSRLLSDTPAVGPLFWSSDGREIVFIGDDNALVALDVERGTRRVLTEIDTAGQPLRGGDWLGQTLALGLKGTISIQDVSGRTPRRSVTTLDAARELYHGWPVLVDDRRFFYTVGLRSGGTETRLGLLDEGRSIPLALPSTTSRVRLDHRGYLVFAQNRVLMAQRVDLETGAVSGSPIRLAPEVFQNPDTGWAAADVSRNSVVVWRAPGIDDAQFEWVDREGRTGGVIGQPDAYTNFDVSPDGSQIVAVRRRGETASMLFLIDPARNVTTPISDQSMGDPVSDPTWSPDGQQIAYRRGGSLVVRPVFGGEERVVRNWAAYPDSWSRDGKYLVVGRPRGIDYELWAVALEGGEADDLPLVREVSIADEPRFSPDGKWVAFHAAVQGPPQVFAIRFPPTGERWQLSTAGGVQPRWADNGRELFYLDSDGQVMMVATPDGDPTRASSPKPLFGLRLEPSTAFDQFAPVNNGERFVVRRALRPGGADTGQVHVIVNWPETIQAAAPPR